MKPEVYNSILVIMSLIMCIFIARVAYVHDVERAAMQTKLNAECTVLAQGKDFIANTTGCYIKH